MKYKVIALSVNSDKIQKVLSDGDIVTEDMFHDGHVPQLVEQGFLEAYDEPTAEPAAEPTEPTAEPAAEPPKQFKKK